VAKLKPELFFSSIFAKNKKPHYRSGVLVFGTSVGFRIICYFCLGFD
jgi:hypothetical protein